MDNLTHTLVALTLARTRLGRSGRGATAALVIASNAPDIDALSLIGGASNYLAWHRGPTHGPLGVIGLGALTAGLVWGAGRLSKDKPSAPFRSLLIASLIGVLGHILMDLPTSYGTRILSPFSWHWFAVDWLPIVDIYLLVALAAGLIFGRMSEEARRHNLAIVVVLVTANYGVRAVAHHEALVLAPRLFGPTLPSRCADAPPSRAIDSWPTAEVHAPPSGKRCLVELAAMPTFPSPFRWRIIARLSNAYELHDLDLLDSRFRTEPSAGEVLWRLAVRFPNQWTPEVTSAARGRIAQIFLGFSRFPAARSIVDASGTATVRWSDMRFVGGILSAQPRPQQLGAFGVTIQVAQDGRIVQEQFGP